MRDIEELSEVCSGPLAPGGLAGAAFGKLTDDLATAAVGTPSLDLGCGGGAVGNPPSASGAWVAVGTPSPRGVVMVKCSVRFAGVVSVSGAASVCLVRDRERSRGVLSSLESVLGSLLLCGGCGGVVVGSGIASPAVPRGLCVSGVTRRSRDPLRAVVAGSGVFRRVPGTLGTQPYG